MFDDFNEVRRTCLYVAHTLTSLVVAHSCALFHCTAVFWPARHLASEERHRRCGCTGQFARTPYGQSSVQSYAFPPHSLPHSSRRRGSTNVSLAGHAVRPAARAHGPVRGARRSAAPRHQTSPTRKTRPTTTTSSPCHRATATPSPRGPAANGAPTPTSSASDARPAPQIRTAACSVRSRRRSRPRPRQPARSTPTPTGCTSVADSSRRGRGRRACRTACPWR